MTGVPPPIPDEAVERLARELAVVNGGVAGHLGYMRQARALAEMVALPVVIAELERLEHSLDLMLRRRQRGIDLMLRRPLSRLNPGLRYARAKLRARAAELAGPAQAEAVEHAELGTMTDLRMCLCGARWRGDGTHP